MIYEHACMHQLRESESIEIWNLNNLFLIWNDSDMILILIWCKSVNMNFAMLDVWYELQWVYKFLQWFMIYDLLNESYDMIWFIIYDLWFMIHDQVLGGGPVLNEMKWTSRTIRCKCFKGLVQLLLGFLESHTLGNNPRGSSASSHGPWSRVKGWRIEKLMETRRGLYKL